MPVAESAASAPKELHFLAVGGHFAEKFACLRIEDNCYAWNVDNHIFTVFAK